MACFGVDDLVIVDTNDALLVTTRARSQEVRLSLCILYDLLTIIRLRNSSPGAVRPAGSQLYELLLISISVFAAIETSVIPLFFDNFEKLR